MAFKHSKFFTTFVFLWLTGASALYAQTAPQLADQIVAQVNEKIILKSEIDRSVADYMRQAAMAGQPLEFTPDLWYAFLESSINNFILLEKAAIDSIVVSDDEVNLQMDQRMQQLIAQAGSEAALERAFGRSIIQIKADFREDFREQILANRVQQMKLQTISITRPEVREFFESIPKDSIPDIPEQVALSQIVIIPPVKADAKKAAYDFAKQIRDSIIVHGVPFEEMARRYSKDPSGRNGGALPLLPMDDLVSEYSAAAAALQPGGISEVVETQFGFHIIRLERRVGDNIETSHILLTIQAGETDDEFAINRLTEIRDSLLSNTDIKFADVARELSEDPSSASMGGKILDPQTGERLISLNRLDPAVYRVVLMMDGIGAISEPRPFTLTPNGQKAFRIIRLDNQVPEHRANLVQDYERIKALALQQKQMNELEKWMQDLRDDIYVEYKIPVPGLENE